MKKILAILGIVTATVTMVALTFVFHRASATAVFGETCALTVFPYNPLAATDTVDDVNTTEDEVGPHIQSLNETCDQHIRYGQAYQLPLRKEDNRIQPGSEAIRAPISKHEYAYFNNSNHEYDCADTRDGRRCGQFFYKSFIKEFEITIHNDGFALLDFSRLSCDTTPSHGYTGTPGDILICEGTAADLYGGTSIHVAPDELDSSKKKITWTFGVNNPSLLPQRYGNNGADFRVFQEKDDGTIESILLDTTSPRNRMYQVGVNLPLLETLLTRTDLDIWSATTSARAKIGDYAIRKDQYVQGGSFGANPQPGPHWDDGCINNNVNDPGSGWCFLQPKADIGLDGEPYEVTPVITNNAPSTMRNYFWYPIGSVGTVWRKPELPTLTLVKTVVNDNGRILQVSNFPLFINGSTPATSGVPVALNPGTYRASETNQEGYIASAWGSDCAADGSVTLNFGERKTCTITNDDIPVVELRANLTVIKNVINDNDGTLQVANFPLFINGTSTTSGATVTLAAGSYTVTETNQPNYSASFSGDCNASGVVILSANENKSCTITNNDVPPPGQLANLTVIKNVINDNGGTLQASHFPLFINGAPTTSGVTVTLAPGSYTVTENTQSNYAASYSGDCNGNGIVTLNAGENKICTITNNDIGNVPPPPLLCTDLQINTDKIFRDASTGGFVPEQTFRVTSIQPFGWSGVIRWTHRTSRGEQIVENNSRATFNGFDETSVVTVQAAPVANPAACTKQALPETRRPPEEVERSLAKIAYELTSRGNVITDKPGKNIAEFQVTYRATGDTPELTIRDSMRRELVGSEGSKIELQSKAFQDKSFKLQRRSAASVVAVQDCDDDDAADNPACYDGSPFTNAGMKVFGLAGDQSLILTYRGILKKSKITSKYCRDNLDTSFCGEEFPNRVSVSVPGAPLMETSDILYTPCPFLLTRGIGDVILEEDLSVGADVTKCGAKNIEGPVIRPPDDEEPEINKTGPNDFLPTHKLCEQSNDEFTPSVTEPEDLRPLGYRNPLKTVSSAICELSLTLADVLTPPVIRRNVLENITRITRYNANLGQTSTSILNLNDPLFGRTDPSLNPNNKVYRLKGSPTARANLTIAGNQILDAGAQTYVIENGDLIIKGNIEYAPTKFDLAALDQVPVIAFIVINGDIKIDKSVTKLAGTFVSISDEKTKIGGRLLGLEDSPNPLRFDGSVFGDIEPLLKSRSFLGNPNLGEGTVVVNYDGRLFYNMPPGLQEILEIAPEQVAR